MEGSRLQVSLESLKELVTLPHILHVSVCYRSLAVSDFFTHREIPVVNITTSYFSLINLLYSFALPSAFQCVFYTLILLNVAVLFIS